MNVSESVRLDHLFPNMVEVDKSVSTWPWLRRDVDHPFRVDRRNPIVGFINRDEASILFGTPPGFSPGKRDWRSAPGEGGRRRI